MQPDLHVPSHLNLEYIISSSNPLQVLLITTGKPCFRRLFAARHTLLDCNGNLGLCLGLEVLVLAAFSMRIYKNEHLNLISQAILDFVATKTTATDAALLQEILRCRI